MTLTQWRALALLLVTFVAGGAAGGAIDRAYFSPRREAAVARRPSRPGGEVEADRIPIPLEALQLTSDEERRLHEIARRWRPRTAELLEQVRGSVSELENGMFAEMLCVISKDKQDRYLAQLQENGGDAVLIDKRFRLVRANQCPGSVRDSTRR